LEEKLSPYRFTKPTLQFNPSNRMALMSAMRFCFSDDAAE
jgi:hypothetical protein